MDQDATLRPPLDPLKGFIVEGVRYRLDPDPDLPQLWRHDGKNTEIPVATFGPSWGTYEVWLAAVEDRSNLKAWDREHGAGGG